MRALIVALSIPLLVASVATAGTDLEKTEKQMRKRAVPVGGAPAIRKSLCVCNEDLLSGYVGRLEYSTQTVGATLVNARCHIFAFDAASGAALAGGSTCTSFTILP
jgi:hypothetical protein